MDTRYDVIIIGGRPAGATLAARLGMAGVSVLLVDRASFPSLPPVSSPIIYSCTMTLLDEIGVDEADYARGTPKIRKLATEMREPYRGIGPIPMDRGRDYAYAVDRARFDEALWRRAASLPSVTVCQEFSVTDLLWDGETVIGILGKRKGEQPRPFYADLVVGADGRSSIVARKTSALLYDVHTENPVSYYYAYWRNVAPYDLAEPLLLTHSSPEGFGYLLMDSADGTTAITIGSYTRNFDAVPHTDAEDLYLKVLQKVPRVWERLRNAERVSSVRGLKNVPNYYRQPGGVGWALVGDAAHHKDPLGGQGIYDAVFGARLLAQNVLAYRAGEVDWPTAIARYKVALEAETGEMYRNTLANTANYGPSNALMQALGRYLCEDTELLERMLRVPSRTVPPARAVSTPSVIRSVARGMAGDARRMMTGETSPASVPPLPNQPRTSNPRLGCLGWLVLLPFVMAANSLPKLPWRRD